MVAGLGEPKQRRRTRRNGCGEAMIRLCWSAMRLIMVVALAGLSVGAYAQDDGHSDAARASLVQGVDAFKAGQYDDAVRDFQAAVDTEPEWRTARLYLATALSYEVVPNLDTPENVATANRALDQFDVILASDPQNLAALRQVAAIERNIKRYDEAMTTERKIIAIDPKDAEAHYTVGVIEWTQAYKFTVETLAKESLRDDGNGNVKLNAAGCAALVANNSAVVNDAIAELTRAVELRPNYHEAMQYLNLTYRQKANLDCGNAEQRGKDLAAASDWTQRAIEARRASEQQKMQQLGNGPMQ